MGACRGLQIRSAEECSYAGKEGLIRDLIDYSMHTFITVLHLVYVSLLLLSLALY